VGDEASTELGCGLMSMIQVLCRGCWRGRRKQRYRDIPVAKVTEKDNEEGEQIMKTEITYLLRARVTARKAESGTVGEGSTE